MARQRVVLTTNTGNEYEGMVEPGATGGEFACKANGNKYTVCCCSGGVLSGRRMGERAGCAYDVMCVMLLFLLGVFHYASGGVYEGEWYAALLY